MKDNYPEMISHRKIASRMGVNTTTIRKWIVEGKFPRPRMIVGAMMFYPITDIDSWFDTGVWPAGVRFSREESL